MSSSESYQAYDVPTDPAEYGIGDEIDTIVLSQDPTTLTPAYAGDPDDSDDASGQAEPVSHHCGVHLPAVMVFCTCLQHHFASGWLLPAMLPPLRYPLLSPP